MEVKMDTNDSFGSFVLGSIVGVTIAWVLVLMFYAPMYSSEIKMAIEQCEQDLPRSQNCTYVISAEVERVN